MKYLESKYPELIPINKEIEELTEKLKGVKDYESTLNRIIELQSQRSVILKDNHVIL